MASELPKLMALVEFEDGPPLGALLPVPIVLPAEGLGGSALALLEWARANPDEARKMNAASRKAWLSCPACGFTSPFIPCQRCGTEIPIKEAE